MDSIPIQGNKIFNILISSVEEFGRKQGAECLQIGLSLTVTCGIQREVEKKIKEKNYDILNEESINY